MNHMLESSPKPRVLPFGIAPPLTRQSRGAECVQCRETPLRRKMNIAEHFYRFSLSIHKLQSAIPSPVLARPTETGRPPPLMS
jgi:hypothetical protein